MSATRPAQECEVNWDAFMGTTRSLLQSRSPKVRTQNLTIDVPVMAGDPDVTSEQRTELVLALIDAYPLYRDRPSRLLLQSAVDTILHLEAQKSSGTLAHTGLFKQLVESLDGKVDEFKEPLSKQRGERRMCARLYKLACTIMRRVMQAETEAALRESKNWKLFMLVHVRLCDLIFGPEHEKKRMRFDFDHLQVHVSCACTAISTICSIHEKIPLLFETLGELAASLPTPTAALAALQWPIEACLYLQVGKEQVRAAPGNVGRKYLREYKEYLLQLFVTHVVGSKAIPPARSFRVFYGLLHTEVSVTDVEQSVFPEMDKTYTRSTEQVLRVAAFLAGNMSYSTLNPWVSRKRKPRYKCALQLRRDTTALGDLRKAIALRFLKEIYPSVTSTDPGTRDAAFSLFQALRLSEEEKYELLCLVLRDVHLEDLTQPEQRQGLYALLNLLPTSVEAIEALGQFVLMERHQEPLRMAVRSLLNIFTNVSQEAALPNNVAPALLTQLRSSDVSVRLMVLSEMTSDSWHRSYYGSVVPRDKGDRPRTALLEQLVPAIEACLEMASKRAHLSSDAALEACIAMQMLLSVPEENCSPSILRALRSNFILQCPLKARPQPSFLLDHRTALRMYEVKPSGSILVPTALCKTLYYVVHRHGVHALDDPDIKNLVFQQIREQMRIQFSNSCSVAQFAGLLHYHDKSALAVELINYLAYSFARTNEFSNFIPRFSFLWVEDYGPFRDWFPQMIVSAHISGKSGPENTAFEKICEAEHIDAHEQVSTRVDEYLSLIHI